MSEVITIRKKPIEVQAIQWDGENFDRVYDFTDGFIRTCPEAGCIEVFDYLHESWIKVKKNDYILRGLKGEYYPHDGSLLWGAYDKV